MFDSIRSWIRDKIDSYTRKSKFPASHLTGDEDRLRVDLRTFKDRYGGGVSYRSLRRGRDGYRVEIGRIGEFIGDSFDLEVYTFPRDQGGFDCMAEIIREELNFGSF